MKFDAINLSLIAVIVLAAGSAARTDPPPCDNRCREAKTFLIQQTRRCVYHDVATCEECSLVGVCSTFLPPLAGACQQNALPTDKKAYFEGCVPKCMAAPNLQVEASIDPPPADLVDSGLPTWTCR